MPPLPAEAVDDFSAAINLEPGFADFVKRRGQALAGAWAWLALGLGCLLPSAALTCHPKAGDHLACLPALPALPADLVRALACVCASVHAPNAALGEDERAAVDIQRAIELSTTDADKVGGWFGRQALMCCTLCLTCCGWFCAGGCLCRLLSKMVCFVLR
jgi:hypothetical protein